MFRLPITDEFLWELFDLYWEIKDIFNLPPKTWREVGIPPSERINRIIQKRKSKYTFKKLIDHLSKAGYIKVKSLGAKKGVILTQKGMEKVLKIGLYKMKKRKRKDGEWVMVIFDIPEKKRKLRDFFREQLQILGFKELQKSVWVSPYDVLKEVQFLIQRFSLTKYTKIFLIKEQEI